MRFMPFVFRFFSFSFFFFAQTVCGTVTKVDLGKGLADVGQAMGVDISVFRDDKEKIDKEFNSEEFGKSYFCGAQTSGILSTAFLNIKLKDCPIYLVDWIESRKDASYNEQSARYTKLAQKRKRAPRTLLSPMGQCVYDLDDQLKVLEETQNPDNILDTLAKTTLPDSVYEPGTLDAFAYESLRLVRDEKARKWDGKRAAHARALIRWLDHAYAAAESLHTRSFLAYSATTNVMSALRAIYFAQRSEDVMKLAEELFALNKDGSENKDASKGDDACMYRLSNEMRRLAMLRSHPTQLTWTVSLYSLLHMITEEASNPLMADLIGYLSACGEKAFPEVFRSFRESKIINELKKMYAQTYTPPPDAFLKAGFSEKKFETDEVRPTLHIGDFIEVQKIQQNGGIHEVANAAGTSFGNATKEFTDGDAEKLVQKLLQWGHETPFEHVFYTLRFFIPIFAWRQFARYRLANLEFLKYYYNCFYIPDEIRVVSTDTNKKNEKVSVDAGIAPVKKFVDALRALNEEAHDAITEAEELAPMIMPAGAYVEARVTANLREWLHIITQRMGEGAQKEAQKIAKLVNVLLDPLFRKIPPESEKDVSKSKRARPSEPEEDDSNVKKLRTSESEKDISKSSEHGNASNAQGVDCDLMKALQLVVQRRTTGTPEEQAFITKNLGDANKGLAA